MLPACTATFISIDASADNLDETVSGKTVSVHKEVTYPEQDKAFLQIYILPYFPLQISCILDTVRLIHLILFQIFCLNNFWYFNSISDVPSYAWH